MTKQFIKPAGMLVTTSLLTLLAGCSSTTKPENTDGFVVPASFLEQTKAEKAKSEAPEATKQAQPRYSETQIGTLGGIRSGASLLVQLPEFSSDEPVKIALNEMPLPQLAHYIFGEVLKLSYVMAPDIETMTQQAALNLNTDVAPKELFEITRQVLAQQGVDVYTKANIVYLAKAQNSAGNKSVGIGAQLSDLPESGEQIVQLVPYTFNSVRGITNITSKLTGAQVFPDTTNRLLVVEGSRADVERTLQIVKMLDVPNARGRDVRLLSLVFLSPDEMIKQVGELLQAEGLQLGEDLSLVSLPRLNSVVVYAASSVLADRVSMWAQKLDVASGGEAMRFYVYRPEYAKADEMVQAVQGLMQNNSAAQRGNNTASGSNGQGGNSNASSSSPSPVASVGQGLKITVDKAQNALIVHATPSRYQEIYSLLQQMDRLPGQVAMQVMIVEKDITDQQSAGFSAITYNSEDTRADSGNATFDGVNGKFSFGIFNGDWNTTFNLISKQTDTKVLSRPYLIVKDGESAAISAGDQVPIITGQSNSDETPGIIRNQVQYRSTGISFTVTPTINADGLVSLVVSSDTSAAVPLTADAAIPTPTIRNRSLTTSVMVGSGQTVVLGGLIKEDLKNIDSKVPFFGKIPLIGKLFQYKDDGVTRTELMIIITPRIIRNTSEMDEFGRKLGELYSFPVEQN
jgi:general secretion pathway protein D